MTPGPFEAIAPGAASQLGALLASVAGAVLMAGLVRGGLWWMHRGRDAAASSPTAPAPARSAPVRRFLGAILLLALVLPTAVAVRQLWPHPDLGPRLVITWLVILLLPTAAWLLIRGGGPSGRPRS